MPDDRFHIYDTTLRDGAQQQGLSLTVGDKLAIARHLDTLGVGLDPMLYQHIDPLLVGNDMKMIIPDVAGRASVELKGRELGIDVAGDRVVIGQVAEQVKDMEARGYTFESADASFELLLRTALGEQHEYFTVNSWRVTVERGADGVVSSQATVKVSAQGSTTVAAGEGDSPVRALDNALRAALERTYPELADLARTEYRVRVLAAPGGANTVIQVVLECGDADCVWNTVGVDEDIIVASWEALEQAVTYCLLRSGRGGRSTTTTAEEPEAVERMRQLAAWFPSASVVRPETVLAGPVPVPRPRLLLVGGASPVASSIDIAGMALRQAASRGIHTHLTHRAEVLPQIGQATKLANAVSAADPDRAEETRRWAIGARAEGECFDMVLGLRDSVQAATADAAELFGVPGNPPAVVRCVQNKDSCRAALAAAGFRQPPRRLCTSARDAIEFMDGSVGPWVVKPRDAAGSLGVRKVAGPDDLPQALRELPDPDLFLIEEMLSGPEYSVEGVFLSGKPRVLAVIAKYLLPPPHFVEAGHVIPAELPDEQRAEIEREVIRALAVLGLRAGIFHVELWLTADGIVLGEVHPRPAGDWVHRLMTYAMPGLEIFGLLYDDMTGFPARANLRPVRAAAIRYLTAAPGRVVAVHGWDAILYHPAVQHAELDVRPGDLVPPVRSSGDRPGFVIVGASNPAEAREIAWALADSVRIVTEPVSEADVVSILGGKK